MSQLSSNINKNNTQTEEEEDEDLVILPDVDNSELIARFQLSLVGRLFNRERRSVEALIALLPRPNIWDVEGRVRGVDLGNHRFQFDFDSETDLQKVLSKRPCHFNKWSFALERWTPHVGDSFPHMMTFWVCTTGIPTHFWLEPIFRALGKKLGLVGEVEAKTAKFQVEVDAELPLKFSLRAQLPSGEIVHVALEYVNLHRWCHHCRLLSHEADTCPQRILGCHCSRNDAQGILLKETTGIACGNALTPVMLPERITVVITGHLLVTLQGKSLMRKHYLRFLVAIMLFGPLQKRLSEEQKLKGKATDLGNSSDDCSSAKKSLKFDDEKPPLALQPIPPLPHADKGLDLEMKSMEVVEDLDAEKILEDEDWMVDEDNFDDDDLMEDDELLLKDLQQEEDKRVSREADPEVLSTESETGLEESKGKPERATAMTRTDLHHASSPMNKVTQSPTKKTRASPIGMARSSSLKKRSLLMGRASPRSKAIKSGPMMDLDHKSPLSKDISGAGKSVLSLKTSNKTKKVGSCKPPKIPR